MDRFPRLLTLVVATALLGAVLSNEGDALVGGKDRYPCRGNRPQRRGAMTADVPRHVRRLAVLVFAATWVAAALVFGSSAAVSAATEVPNTRRASVRGQRMMRLASDG